MDKRMHGRFDGIELLSRLLALFPFFIREPYGSYVSISLMDVMGP